MSFISYSNCSSKYSSPATNSLESSLLLSLSNFRDLVSELEQLHINSENFKTELKEHKQKCDSNSCKSSEALKGIISAKDKIIQLTASALTKFNETKNFNIVDEIFKILSGAATQSLPTGKNVVVKMEQESPVYSPEKDFVPNVEQLKEESLMEIEGTPTGRKSPIIQPKKLRSGITNSSDYRDKKKCPSDWYTMLTILSSLSHARLRHYTPRLRVVEGWSDSSNRYPFVVSLISEMPTGLKEHPIMRLRSCTGSLITSQFVLTAAHCLEEDVRFVRCGNMSLRWDNSKCISKVLKYFPYAGYLQVPIKDEDLLFNDIALIQVEKLVMMTYGRLHTADYKTLSGKPVRYAGFGRMSTSTAINWTEIEKLQKEELQIGEGVIFYNADTDANIYDGKFIGYPQLSIHPKCSKRNQHAYQGDSGGPLFVGGKIAGVTSNGNELYINNKQHVAYVVYTAVSPFLDWIRSIIKEP